MTFFNYFYFPTKEHAVDLLMACWLFEIEASIAKKGRRGVAAIEHTFGMLGDEVARAPERTRRLQGYFASRANDRPLPSLGAAEREALGGGPETGALGLGALFVRLVTEAREDGGIELEGTSYEIAHYLGALATGASLIGHSSAKTDWRRLFRRHVRRALGRLGDGADPPPPRVPPEYREGRGRKRT